MAYPKFFLERNKIKDIIIIPKCTFKKNLTQKFIKKTLYLFH